MSELNENEKAVLRACIESSEGNDHDFGFTDEVRPEGFTLNQIKGYLSSLEKKDYISIYHERVNGERVDQFIFSKKALDFLGIE